MPLDLEEKKGELEESSHRHKAMKDDGDGMNKRHRKLSYTLYRLGNKVKECDLCIKELEFELASSGKEICRLSPQLAAILVRNRAFS